MAKANRTKKKRVGRPKMDARLKRNRDLRAPVTRMEHRLFEECAELEGLSVSEWIRQAAYEKSKRDLGPKWIGQFLEELETEDFEAVESAKIKRRLMR